MQRLSKWISNKNNGKITILTLFIFLAFITTVLPAQSKRFDAYTNGAGSIDLRFWYSTEEVYELAESYEEEGRQAYIRSALSFDVIWPINYMLFLTSAISFLGKKIFPDESKFQLLNLTPLIGMLLDYFENGLASLTFHLYPERIQLLTRLLPFVTFLKWVFVSGASLLILIYFDVWWLKAMSKRNSK